MAIIDVSSEYPRKDHANDQHRHQYSKPTGYFRWYLSRIILRKIFQGIRHSHSRVLKSFKFQPRLVTIKRNTLKQSQGYLLNSHELFLSQFSKLLSSVGSNPGPTDFKFPSESSKNNP